MRISIHTSDRSSFKRCRQRWDFSSNLRGNMEPSRPVTPLFFGTGVHEALAYYYTPELVKDSDGAIATFQDYVLGWLKALDSPTEDNEIWANEQLELGNGMLEYYFKWAEDAKDVSCSIYDTDFEVIWVEKEFDVPIPGLPGVSYSFRVDGLVRDKHDRFWILEHKTTAQFTEALEWLQLDDQCGSYLWGLSQLGIEAEGVIYNELKKKTPQPLRTLSRGGFSINRSQDTTFEIALQTLKDNYKPIPRHYWDFLDFLKYKPNNFVRRTPVRRNRKEIEALGTMLRYEVMDMLNNPAIYRNPSRINCTTCPFISPCILKWEGGDVDWLLGSEFKEREGYYGRVYSRDSDSASIRT